VSVPPRPDVSVTGEDVYLARTEADAAALAVGFGVATGGTADVGADAFGVPVVDVERAGWVAAATHARDVLGMDFLDWLSAVDEPDRAEPGVDVVLHVAASASVGDAAFRRRRAAGGRVRRLMLRTAVPNADPLLASLTGIWPGVAWHERETFEMFGVTFTGFADGTEAGLRPLLLPEGFEGTPLRKSFVLTARASKPWPGAKEPGESAERTARSPGRRKTAPPGVPDPSWGPREAAEPAEPSEPAEPTKPAEDAEAADPGAES
jgi:NADH-quinone oxidoreductase subunit C